MFKHWLQQNGWTKEAHGQSAALAVRSIVSSLTFVVVFTSAFHMLPQPHFDTTTKTLSLEPAVLSAYAAGTTTIIITDTASTSWQVPADWNDAANVIHVIGGGGGGGKGEQDPPYSPGGGGGGGGYARIVNIDLTPGATLGLSVGTAGTGATANETDGVDGGDTYLCRSTTGCSSLGDTNVLVSAEGGTGGGGGNEGGVTYYGGAGGATTTASGTVKYAGGDGGTTNYLGGEWNGGAGGGGAAGPNGDGGDGGAGLGSSSSGNAAGGGGGGANGGSAGGDAASGLAGTGGNNRNSTGGGTVSNNTEGGAGSDGGGGGGGDYDWAGGDGSMDAIWDSTYGPGGGGGGHGSEQGNSGKGDAGGYGGGGGGTGETPSTFNAGDGTQGIIVIEYTPASLGASTWNASDWTLYDTITIDAANIDDDLTDFPVYVDLSDLSSQFWSTTPSASSTVGTDIRVTNSANQELPRELVFASSTAQTGELHFKADTISSSADTVFKIWYNGSTAGDYATDATYGAENVWTNFAVVWHMNEFAQSDSAGNFQDSYVQQDFNDPSVVDGNIVVSGANEVWATTTPENAIDFTHWNVMAYWDEDGTTGSGKLSEGTWNGFQIDFDVTGDPNTSLIKSGTASAQTVNGAPQDSGRQIILIAYDDDAGEVTTYSNGEFIATSTGATPQVAWDEFVSYRMQGTHYEARGGTTTISAAYAKAQWVNFSTTTDFYNSAAYDVKAWNASDWTLFDTITIDSTQVDDDLTDFPVYVDLSDLTSAFWSTTPSASSTVGTDIRVTNASNVELPRELVFASSTAQTGELHFKADTISSSTDTVFKIWYNGTTTGDYPTYETYGAENVWTDFAVVWHMNEVYQTDSAGNFPVASISYDPTLDINNNIVMDSNDSQQTTHAGSGINFTDWSAMLFWDESGSTNGGAFGEGSFNSFRLRYMNVTSNPTTMEMRAGNDSNHSIQDAVNPSGKQILLVTYDSTLEEMYVYSNGQLASTTTGVDSGSAWDAWEVYRVQGTHYEARGGTTTASAAYAKAQWVNFSTTTDFYTAGSSDGLGTTTLSSTASDPLPFTVAPGSAATVTDAFSFVTSEGTDTITEITLAHQNASSTSLIEVVSNDGNTVYGSTAAASGTSTSISLSTNISIGTSETTYKVRMTPKSHANLPSGNRGEIIPFSARVLSWTGSNTATGTDSSKQVFIDNQSLPGFGVENDALSFAASTSYATTRWPYGVTMADLNNDGWVDMIPTYDSGSRGIDILFNDGDGTFTYSTSYTAAAYAILTRAADFNNDDWLDLAILSNFGSLHVYTNDGDGTFTLATTSSYAETSAGIDTADFDGDGWVDIAFSQGGSNSTFSIIYNKGNNTFTSEYTYDSDDYAAGLTAADVNNDGLIDVIQTDSDADVVMVMLNTGDRTFAADARYGSYGTGQAPREVIAEDLNSDGWLDLVTVNNDDGNIAVFMNDGDGTFATNVIYPAGASSDSITAADFNNDGHIDLLVDADTPAYVTIFLNDGDGTFDTSSTTYTTDGLAYVTSADVNNDGLTDFMVANEDTNSVSVFLNNAPSTLSATTTGATAGQALISYTTPSDDDLAAIVVLADTSAVTDVPVDGTTYTGGETIGSATVVCVDSSVATSSAESCETSGLSGSTEYYFSVFTKDSYGNYSFAVTPEGSPLTTEAAAAPAWNITDWTLYDTITIDAANIDSTLTDFPVYVDLSDLSATFWSTTPSASTTVGTDIRVTNASNIELPRELVAASSTAQTGELHFKADSISSTTDTTFKIWYNGTTTGDYATDATYGAENVWIDNYVAVYHDGGETDSTMFNRTAAPQGSVVEGNTAGPVGFASDLNGTDQAFISTDSTGVNGLNSFTASMWIRYDGGAIADEPIYSIQSGNYDDVGDNSTTIRFDASGSVGGDTDVFKAKLNTSGYGPAGETTNGTAEADKWMLMHQTWDNSTNVVFDLFKNGSVMTWDTGAEPTSAYNTIQSDVVAIGRGNKNGWWTGAIDEFRIASTSLSADWIAAEHLNQSTTTDFYTVNLAAITGSSTISDHDAGQVGNAFNFQNKTNEPLFAFKITPNSGNATVTDTVINISGSKDINQSDFSNIRLYQDDDNDAAYDAGDTVLDATGVMSISGQHGSITFDSDYLLTTATNYLVVADWNAPERGSYFVLDLLTSGLSMIDSDGAVTVDGSVDRVQHNRNNRGGGGAAASIGGAAPEGDGEVTGGEEGGSGGDDAIDTNTGGDTIGSSPDFYAPTNEFGGWTNPGNAYDATDGTYATANSGVLSDYVEYNDSVPGSDTIEGIAVKMEISGTTAAGDIDVQLSWNGGGGWTTVKTTPTVTTTDTVVILGGASDTWGRSWSPSEINNTDFGVRVTANPSSNTLRIDEIQVKIYHQAAGGGGGGGGAI